MSQMNAYFVGQCHVTARASRGGPRLVYSALREIYPDVRTWYCDL